MGGGGHKSRNDILSRAFGSRDGEHVAGLHFVGKVRTHAACSLRTRGFLKRRKNQICLPFNQLNPNKGLSFTFLSTMWPGKSKSCP
jgi:hypothetical protein